MVKKARSMKGGATYTASDIDKIVIKDNIEYIEDKDAVGEPLLDIVTLEPIKHDRAILVQGQFYDIDSIYKWIVTHNSPTCPLRNEVKDVVKTAIIDKYIQVHPQGNTSRVHYNPYRQILSFDDNITRGDLFRLKDGTYLYAYSWYLKVGVFLCIYCVESLNSKTPLRVELDQIVGYILQGEPGYNDAIRTMSNRGGKPAIKRKVRSTTGKTKKTGKK